MTTTAVDPAISSLSSSSVIFKINNIKELEKNKKFKSREKKKRVNNDYISFYRLFSVKI